MGIIVPRLTRNPDITLREVDDALFLVRPRNDGIYYLNPIGAAVWRLLAEPISLSEAVQILTRAFPDIPAGQVRHDVGKLVDEMDTRDFLLWLE